MFTVNEDVGAGRERQVCIREDQEADRRGSKMTDLEAYHYAKDCLEEARAINVKLQGREFYADGQKIRDSWQQREEFYGKVVQALSVTARVKLMYESYVEGGDDLSKF